MNEELLTNIYNLLGGKDTGSYDSFKKYFLNNDQLRRNSWELLGGSKVGTYESFLVDGVGLKIKSPTSKTTETQPQLPPALQADMAMVAKRRSELEASRIDYPAQQPKTASISPEGVYMGGTPDTPKVKYNVDDVLNNEFAYLGRKYSPRDLDIVMHGIDKVNKKEQSIKEAKDLASKYDYVKIPDYNPLNILPRIVDKSDVSAALSKATPKGDLMNLETPMLINLGEKAFAAEIKDARLAVNRLNQSSVLLRNRYNVLDSQLSDRFGTAWDFFMAANEYTNSLDNGGKRNLDYEKSISPVVQLLNDKSSPERAIFEELIGVATKLDENKKSLENIPSVYKNFATIEKLKQDYGTALDTKYKATPTLGKYLYNINTVLMGGIERNVERLGKTVDVLGATVGIDRSQANLEEESEANQTLFSRKASVFNRPLSERIGTVSVNGIAYDVAFDNKGQLLAVYDKDGYQLQLSEEGLKLINSEVEAQHTFQDSKIERNWGSMAFNAADGMVDLAAQIALAKGVGGLGAVMKTGDMGARALEITSMYPQFLGESVTNALREGNLTLTDGIISGFGTATVEALTEGIFPVAGRIASPVKRIAKLGKGIGVNDIISAMGNASTKYAAKRAAIDVGLGMIMEPAEEVAGNYGNYFVQKLTNDYLDGSYDDVHLPTLQENYDTALVTAGTMALSAMFTAPASYHNIKSDAYAQYAFSKTLKADDELVNKVLDNAIASKQLSQEEADNFRQIRSRAKTFEQGLNTINSDKKSTNLKEEILSLWGLKEAYNLKKTGNEEVDKSIDTKIQDLEKEISKKVITLEALKNTSSSAAENPDKNATSQDNKGGMGEDTPNFSFTTIKADYNTSDNLVLDFDDTVWDNSTQGLSKFGEEVKQAIADGKIDASKVFIATARTNNATNTQQKEIADALGIPIENIQLNVVGKAKADYIKNLSGKSTFIDNDQTNIDAVSSEGINSILYTDKPQKSVRSVEDIQKNIDSITKSLEGKNLSEDVRKINEETLKELQNELALTKQNSNTLSEAEAKKADIERRRQEELKERVVYDRRPTVDDGEFKIIGDTNNRIFRVNENTGRPQVLDESNGLWSNTEESPNLFFEIVTRSGFHKSKDKINAKYDTELAELEKPYSQTTKTEENADAKSKTKSVDVGEQAKVSEEVGKRNPQGQETAQESQVQEKVNNPLNLDLANKTSADILNDIISLSLSNGDLVYQNEKGESC